MRFGLFMCAAAAIQIEMSLGSKKMWKDKKVLAWKRQKKWRKKKISGDKKGALQTRRD